MRFIFILYLVVFPFFLIAQSHLYNQPTDSISVYKNFISQRYKQALDSFRSSTDIKQALERLDFLSSRSDNYHSLVIFTDVAAADFGHLNNTLVPEGFNPLKGVISRVGFGFSTKANKVVIDFYVGSLGFNNKAKKEDEKVKASFSNLFQLDLGYDLTRSQSVNIYPYAGISVRDMSLEYNKPKQTNTSYTDLTNIVQNDASVMADVSGLGYQAGVGFDFVLSNNKDRTSGTMLFLKAGTNGAFGHPSYKIGGIKYDPQITYGRWIVTAGFKFFGRRDNTPVDKKR